MNMNETNAIVLIHLSPEYSDVQTSQCTVAGTVEAPKEVECFEFYSGFIQNESAIFCTLTRNGNMGPNWKVISIVQTGKKKGNQTMALEKKYYTETAVNPGDSIKSNIEK